MARFGKNCFQLLVDGRSCLAFHLTAMQIADLFFLISPLTGEQHPR